MKLDRLRAIGKTDKVLLERKPVPEISKKCYFFLKQKKKKPDLIFITIIMDKELNKPRYFSAMKL